MTSEDARRRLEPLIGSELGPGEWSTLSGDRIKLFDEAVAPSGDLIPAMLLLSMIPGLTAKIGLPIDPPRTTVNYGLDRSRLMTPAKAGDRVRARTTLLAIEEGSGWLQMKRRVTLENEAGQSLLEAETLTRLVW
jgi:acyl dehydratase